METQHSINKRQLKQRRSEQKHKQEVSSGVISVEDVTFGGDGDQLDLKNAASNHVESQEIGFVNENKLIYSNDHHISAGKSIPKFEQTFCIKLFLMPCI